MSALRIRVHRALGAHYTIHDETWPTPLRQAACVTGASRGRGAAGGPGARAPAGRQGRVGGVGLRTLRASRRVARVKVLVIGSGGREHALCVSLKKSPRLTRLWCAPGNGGNAQSPKH